MYEILFGKSMLLTALEHKLRAAYSKGRGSVNTSGLGKGSRSPLSVMQMRAGAAALHDFMQQHCEGRQGSCGGVSNFAFTTES